MASALEFKFRGLGMAWAGWQICVDIDGTNAGHLRFASATGASAIFLPLLSSHGHQARCITPKLSLEARRTVGAGWCVWVSVKTAQISQMKRLKIYENLNITLWICGYLLQCFQLDQLISACYVCILSLHFAWLHAYFDHLWSTWGQRKKCETSSCKPSLFEIVAPSRRESSFFSSSTSGFVDSHSPSASHLFISSTCSFLWPSVPVIFLLLLLAFGLWLTYSTCL